MNRFKPFDKRLIWLSNRIVEPALVGECHAALATNGERYVEYV
jgi:hypothetical protein